MKKKLEFFLKLEDEKKIQFCAFEIFFFLKKIFFVHTKYMQGIKKEEKERKKI